MRTRAAAEQSSNLTKAAVAAGLIANPVVLVSEYFLKTTGEGLPPGPGGLYGATEGVSYLVIVGIVGWSLYTKVKTGSGLQGNLLGAVEGLSYLSVVAGKFDANTVSGPCIAALLLIGFPKACLGLNGLLIMKASGAQLLPELMQLPYDFAHAARTA